MQREVNEPNLVGEEIEGHKLTEQYTPWQRTESGVRMARFKTQIGRRVIISLSPIADGSDWIEAIQCKCDCG